MKMKIGELKPAQDNVRVHPDAQINELKRSIQKFGQIRPIVIDEHKKILAGNGLYSALVQLGEDTANVLQMKNLSETDKKKLMLSDNKIFSLGLNDNEKIHEILEELAEEKDFDIPGFDDEILQDIFSDLENTEQLMEDYGKIDEKQTEFKKNNPSGHKEIQLTNPDIQIEDDEGMSKPFIQCPKCGNKIWL